MSVRSSGKSSLGLSALPVLPFLLWGCGGNSTRDFQSARDFEREVSAICGVMPFDDYLYPALRSALNEGRTRFEPAQSERCLGWLRSHSCPRDVHEALGLFTPRLPGLCRETY